MTLTASMLDVFQDLKITPRKYSLRQIREALIKNTKNPWRHASDKELELSSLYTEGSSDKVIVFEREKSNGIEAIGLVIHEHDGIYEVTNIVPTEKSKLDYSSYNAALKDFIERVVNLAKKDIEFDFELSDSQQDLETWLTHDAAKALKAFSKLANKATGSSHPSDLKRWLSFLFIVHQEKANFDSINLLRWLVEVDKWTEDSASELIFQYDFALELLKQYDAKKNK